MCGLAVNPASFGHSHTTGSDDEDRKLKRGVLPKRATQIMKSWLFQHIAVCVHACLSICWGLALFTVMLWCGGRLSLAKILVVYLLPLWRRYCFCQFPSVCLSQKLLRKFCNIVDYCYGKNEFSLWDGSHWEWLNGSHFDFHYNTLHMDDMHYSASSIWQQIMGKVFKEWSWSRGLLLWEECV